MMRILAIIAAAFSFVLVMAINTAAAPQATASPASTQWTGWCGGPAHTPAQLLSRFQEMGVADDIARRYGVRSVDDTLSNWMHRNIGNALVARKVVLGNEGCRDGAFFEAKDRVLHRGDRVFIDVRPLVVEFGEGNFSLTPRDGWDKVVACVQAFANPTCSNPLNGLVCVFVWVRPHAKTVPPPPPPPPPGQVKILIRKHAFSAADEEQLIFPTPTGTFRFKVQCGPRGKPRFIVYNSDPQPAGTCPATAGRVRVWELDTLGPDRWEHLTSTYQTRKLKGKRVAMIVYKNKQVKRVPAPKPPPPPPPPPAPPPAPPPLPPVTPPSPPPPPKEDTDLCINIDGVQTAVPAGYRKDPPDPGKPGNCFPV